MLKVPATRSFSKAMEFRELVAGGHAGRGSRRATRGWYSLPHPSGRAASRTKDRANCRLRLTSSAMGANRLRGGQNCSIDTVGCWRMWRLRPQRAGDPVGEPGRGAGTGMPRCAPGSPCHWPACCPQPTRLLVRGTAGFTPVGRCRCRLLGLVGVAQGPGLVGGCVGYVMVCPAYCRQFRNRSYPQVMGNRFGGFGRHFESSGHEQSRTAAAANDRRRPMGAALPDDNGGRCGWVRARTSSARCPSCSSSIRWTRSWCLPALTGDWR